jgi:hypothetical protein
MRGQIYYYKTIFSLPYHIIITEKDSIAYMPLVGSVIKSDKKEWELKAWPGIYVPYTNIFVEDDDEERDVT